LKLEDGSQTPEGFPRLGFPTQERDAVQRENDVRWSPLVSQPRTGRYRAIPAPANDTGDQQVIFSDGDRLFLEMTRSASGGRTLLRRGYYSKFYKDYQKQTRGDGEWTLAVPAAYMDVGRAPISLQSLALIESVPPHERPKKDDAIQNPLFVERPDFLWWDVSPLNADKVPETVIIRKLYGYALPAYEIRAEKWPAEPGGNYARGRINVWLENSPRSTPMTVNLNAAGRVTTPQGNETEMHASFEKHPVQRNSGEQKFLVVRASHSDPSTVSIRFKSPRRDLVVEQYCYRKAKCVTAVFGPFEESELAGQPLKFDIVAAPTDPKLPTAMSIETAAPQQDVGRLIEQYRVQPSPPAKE
jgi:hypothetical protein